ncbi:MAG TPA: type II secretion system F family protein [Acidimicrobiales bacterium]|nr:type II secretion system F family protein [Acidimicrobiales bacterium]
MSTTFEYKVRDRGGNLIEGSLDGDNLGLVVSRLRSMGYLPISVTPTNARFRSQLVIPGITDRIPRKDVAVFTRQFATMVESGLSISRALSVLSAQVTNQHLGQVIREVRDGVESGLALSDSLSKHQKVFDELYVSMVRAGELGGSIDVVLKTVATALEKQVAISRKIRGAMTYPVVVVSVISLLFVVMMVVIVPVFKKLFTTLDAPLPTPTKIVIAISNTLVSWHVVIVVVVVVLAVVGFRRWISSERGREKWDAWKLRPPIFGPLMHKTALARFSFTLSSLVSSGVPVLESLDIVGRASGNAVLAKATQEIKRAVREGRSFADPMRVNPIFPQLIVQMVEVGEQTGSLDDMLGKAAAYYQSEVDQTVDNLSSILEPLLVVVMGSVVGTVIISLYLPMLTYIKYVK